MLWLQRREWQQALHQHVAEGGRILQELTGRQLRPRVQRLHEGAEQALLDEAPQEGT